MSLPMGPSQKKDVTLSFGPIACTVSVHGSVAEDKEASLRMVCTNDAGHKDAAGPVAILGSGAPVRVGRNSLCPVCESGEHIGRAKEVGDGLVSIPTEILDKAEAADRAFDHLDVTPHPSADVEIFSRPTGSRYYLNVKGGRSNNYALIREMVRLSPDKAFMARFALKGAAYPYRLVVDGETLALVQMADPSFVRAKPEVSGDIDPQYLELMMTLAEQRVSPFEPANYDRPKTRIISEYVEGKVPTVFSPVADTTSGEVTDLLAALRAEVQANSKPKTKTRKTAAIRSATKPRAVKAAPAKRAS